MGFNNFSPILIKQENTQQELIINQIQQIS